MLEQGMQKQCVIWPSECCTASDQNSTIRKSIPFKKQHAELLDTFKRNPNVCVQTVMCKYVTIHILVYIYIK